MVSIQVTFHVLEFVFWWVWQARRETIQEELDEVQKRCTEPQKTMPKCVSLLLLLLLLLSNDQV